MIEDDYNIANDHNMFWYNKWMHNAAVAAKDLIILDLVQKVV